MPHGALAAELIWVRPAFAHTARLWRHLVAQRLAAALAANHRQHPPPVDARVHALVAVQAPEVGLADGPEDTLDNLVRTRLHVGVEALHQAEARQDRPAYELGLRASGQHPRLVHVRAIREVAESLSHCGSFSFGHALGGTVSCSLCNDLRASVLPSGAARQVLEEVHPHVLELLAVEPQVDEEDAHVVFGARGAELAAVLGARAPGVDGLRGHGQGKDDACLDFACMEAAVLTTPLDRPFGEEGVEVKEAVAAAVIVHRAVVVVSVPGFVELTHRPGHLGLQLLDQALAGGLAVALQAPLVGILALDEELLLALTRLTTCLTVISPAPTWMCWLVVADAVAPALRRVLTTSCSVSMSSHFRMGVTTSALFDRLERLASLTTFQIRPSGAVRFHSS